MEWQRFVTDSMYAKHGASFVQVDPAGRGDKGCDGYLDGLMLAVYGATSVNERYVTNKINDDFAAATSFWGLAMTSWAFVHNNANGLPTAAAKAIVDLRNRLTDAGSTITVTQWPPQVLWDECCAELSRERLTILLGAPPSHHPAGMSYVARCVECLARTRLRDGIDDVNPVPYGKIEYNGFSAEVADIIKTFQTYTTHVRHYYSRSSPGEQSQASEVIRARYDAHRARLGDADAIFHALCDELIAEAFGGADFGDQEEQRSAALMVVTHFFEICDIFESPGGGRNATSH